MGREGSCLRPPAQRGEGYATPIPGAVRVEYLEDRETRPTNEAALRKSILATIAATSSLDRANEIADKSKRAEALFGLLGSEPNPPVFRSLVACGKDAVPFLDRLLAEEDRASLHFLAIHTLEEIDDPSVDSVLVKVVERETAFLRTLPRGAKRDEKASWHQLTTSTALKALQIRKPASCREAVRALREGLIAAALPDSGELVTACDGVLEALGK